MEKGNILIVWDRVGDYHLARVQVLRTLVGDRRVFTADLGGEDGLYGWQNVAGSNQHYPLSAKPVGQRDCLKRGKAFWNLLRRRNIEHVAVAGYGKIEYILFIILARVRGCRITLFAESWYGHNFVKNWFKGLFLKSFCNRFFVSGKRSRDHFHKRLGVPLEKILMGYSVVDNDHYSASLAHRPDPLILCVARFSPEKNLELLITAFLETKGMERFRLRLIGGGPCKQRLRRMADDCERIEIVDWVDYADLPQEYQKADVFILPSRFEPWGLVVNEAMASGLPVVVSDVCGCAPDLVAPDNGFIFKSGDKASLQRVLEKISHLSEADLRCLGDRSLEIISEFSCYTWAHELIESFNC